MKKVSKFFLVFICFLALGGALNPALADEHSPKIAYTLQKTMEECSAADSLASSFSTSDLSNLSNDIVQVTTSGQIEITVHSKTTTGEREEEDLKALGAEIISVLILPPELNLPEVGMIQAWMPYDKIGEVADLPWVVAITPPGYGDVDTHPANPINSEGVAFHNADIAQAQGINGAGITIGTISDGVTNLAASQARNELPPVTVLNAGVNDEGTAMLEIIHDMAPGAALAFNGTGGGVASHVMAMINLVAVGADIIAEDIAFDSQPAFQQGFAALIGDTIAGAGVSIHSSAGNRGNNHAARVPAVGTGSGPDGFNGVFINCTGAGPTNTVAIAPGGDTTFDVVLGANAAGTSGSRFTLQWSEPRAIFPTAGAGGFTNLDLYVMDATGTTCLNESLGIQGAGFGDTIEQITTIPALPGTSAGTSVKIVVNVSGNLGAVAPPTIDLRWRQTQAGGDATTRAGSLNPDSNYTGLATSSASLFVGSGNLENSSSGGPVQLRLTTVYPAGVYPCFPGVAGPAINSTAGPTWAATDGVSVSGVGGFGAGTCPAPSPGGQGSCQFFGTSAAAPHAAACEALVREAIPGATVAGATAQMTGTAVDINPFGPDNITGAGQLDCFAAASPPVAACQNQTVDTDLGVCQTDGVSVDNGSFDPLGDAITLAQNPDNPYPLGATMVDLTATDSVGLSDMCTATVTVEDNEDPTITAPADVKVECTAHNGQVVDIGNATSGDNCSVMVGNDAPGLFPLGITTVNWTATDGSGNTAGDSQDVEVEDTTPPEVFCNAPPTIIPKDAPISFTTTVMDACDATVEFSITEFKCFENKKNGNVVDKAESCVVSIDGDTIHIQDSGGTNDHIQWTVYAVDDSGNDTTKVCEVLVVKKK